MYNFEPEKLVYSLDANDVLRLKGKHLIHRSIAGKIHPSTNRTG